MLYIDENTNLMATWVKMCKILNACFMAVAQTHTKKM